MRYFFFAYLLATVLVVGFAGFRGDKFSHTPIEIFNDMDQQAKVKAQASNAFFADGVGSRKPVTGTVPMGLKIPEATAASGSFASYGFSHGSDYYNTGHIGDFWGDGYPEQVTVDAAFLRLGKERYDINCTPCHGKSGDGKGVTSHYGVPNIANFQTPKFTDPKAPDYRSNGHIYNTINHGFGMMGSYGANIPVKERWAIVAWLRAMELSRSAPLSDPAIREAWTALAPPAAPAAATAAAPIPAK
ncbi:MAG: cytochrome c [Verrucomicrobiota bacterium]